MILKFLLISWLLNQARPGGSTWWLDRFGFNKRSARATTRQNPIDPTGQPMTRATRTRPNVFFFKCGIWNPLIYILYVPKKKEKRTMFFQCGIWNPLVYKLYILKKKIIFFQRGIWNPLINILYIPTKKVMFFQCGIKKLFGLNTST